MVSDFASLVRLVENEECNRIESRMLNFERNFFEKYKGKLLRNKETMVSLGKPMLWSEIDDETFFSRSRMLHREIRSHEVVLRSHGDGEYPKGERINNMYDVILLYGTDEQEMKAYRKLSGDWWLAAHGVDRVGR